MHPSGRFRYVSTGKRRECAYIHTPPYSGRCRRADGTSRHRRGASRESKHVLRDRDHASKPQANQKDTALSSHGISVPSDGELLFPFFSRVEDDLMAVLSGVGASRSTHASRQYDGVMSSGRNTRERERGTTALDSGCKS